MITIPGNVRAWLATGHTDMRRGFRSLALMVQEELKRDPHCGDLYVVRGRRSDLIQNYLSEAAELLSFCCWAPEWTREGASLTLPLFSIARGTAHPLRTHRLKIRTRELDLFARTGPG